MARPFNKLYSRAIKFAHIVESRRTRLEAYRDDPFVRWLYASVVVRKGQAKTNFQLYKYTSWQPYPFHAHTRYLSLYLSAGLDNAVQSKAAAARKCVVIYCANIIRESRICAGVQWFVLLCSVVALCGKTATHFASYKVTVYYVSVIIIECVG